MDASRQSNPRPGSPQYSEDPKGNAYVAVEGIDVSANPERQRNAVPNEDSILEITPEEGSSLREVISLFGSEEIISEFADLEAAQQKEFARLATWFERYCFEKATSTLVRRTRWFQGKRGFREMAT